MLGPVQVLVVDVADGEGADNVLDSLTALPADGPVRCLDAFEATVTPDGELTIAGAHSASQPRSLPLFAEFVDEASVVSSEEGTWHLGEVMAPDSRAVVALLEHRWALDLRD